MVPQRQSQRMKLGVPFILLIEGAQSCQRSLFHLFTNTQIRFIICSTAPLHKYDTLLCVFMRYQSLILTYRIRTREKSCSTKDCTISMRDELEVELEDVVVVV